MFSSDLADGIVVSILDSFSLQLPQLDFSLVQSVLEQLDSNSPQPEVQVQQSTAKNDYFQDIVSLPKTEWQGASDKIPLDRSLLFNSQKERNETVHLTSNTSRSSSGFHTIGKTILEEELCSAVSVSSTENTDVFESAKSVTDSSSDDEVE